MLPAVGEMWIFSYDYKYIANVNFHGYGPQIMIRKHALQGDTQ